MKKILTILSLLICFIANAQGDPKGVPSSKTRWYNGGWFQADSGIINAPRDTSWIPRFVGTQVFWQHAGVDSAVWVFDGFKWNKAGSGGSGTTERFGYPTEDVLGLTNRYINYQTFNHVFDSIGRFNIQTYKSPSLTLDTSAFYVTTGQTELYLDNYGSNDGTAFASISNGSNNIDIDDDVIRFRHSGVNVPSKLYNHYISDSLETANINRMAVFQNDTLKSSSFQHVADSLQPYLPNGLAADTIAFYVLDSLNTPPLSPATNDIYEIGTVPTGAWVGHAGDIATYNGASWDFTDPITGQQLFNDINSIVSKWNGSVWVRVSRLPVFVGGQKIGSSIKIGTTDAQPLSFITNNVARGVFTATGDFRVNNLSGTGTRVALLSSTGTFSALTNTTNGFVLTLSGGAPVWAAAASGGFTTADNGLTASTATNVQLGGSLIKNTTIDGAFTLNLNSSRRITNAADSILDASTKHSIAATDSANVRAAVIYDKSARSFFGATTLAYIGVDSLGFRIQNGLIYALGATTGIGSIGRIDAITKALSYSSTINAATELTGITPVVNGGTGNASFTAYALVAGGTTSTGALQQVSGLGNSGDYLKSNGAGALPTWTSTSGLTPFTRGVLPSASATLNVIYPTNQPDTMFIGSTGDLSSNKPKALFNVNGSTRLATTLSVGTTSTLTGVVGVGGAPNSAVGLYIQDVGSAVGLEINQNSTQSFYIFTTNGGTGSYFDAAVSSNDLRRTATSTTANYTNIKARSSNSVDGSSTQTSGNSTNFLSEIVTSSNSTTDILSATGFSATFGNINSRSQKVAVVTGFKSQITAGDIGGLITASTGIYRAFWADTALITPANLSTGTYYQFFSKDNAGGNYYNIFQPKTSFGSTTTPTAFVYVGAGTTANAQIRLVGGVAPTSPNAFDIWSETTNNRLMFRQNATSVEVLGVSAVNSVSPTAQNRTITVLINGTTYYLTAKTTND